MEKNTKQIYGFIAFGIVLFVALSHLGSIWKFVGNIGSVIAPIGIGFILAFVLNVPVSGFEKLLARLAKKNKKGDLNKLPINPLSILLTFLCIALAITLVCTMAIPEIVSSVKSIVSLIEEKWPVWMALLNETDFASLGIVSQLETLDIKQFFGQFVNGAGSAVAVLAGTMSTAASGFTNTMLALVIAIYVLSSKKVLARQARKLLYAYSKKHVADQVCKVAGLIHSTYSKFLSGQCVEAIILGVLIFIAFSIVRLPYAGLIAILTAFCAFIPYVGALISCVIGAFLILLISPTQALIGVIVYLCVQFIENQFIYPRVVGSSVGLSPLWTMIALIVGGKLLGLIGMLFFIPFASVLYTLLKDITNQRLEKHN